MKTVDNIESLFDSVEELERKPTKYVDDAWKKSRDYSTYRSKYELTRREDTFDD